MTFLDPIYTLVSTVFHINMFKSGIESDTFHVKIWVRKCCAILSLSISIGMNGWLARSLFASPDAPSTHDRIFLIRSRDPNFLDLPICKFTNCATLCQRNSYARLVIQNCFDDNKIQKITFFSAPWSW